MARHNVIILRGIVNDDPRTGKNKDGTSFAFVRVTVARALRDTGDGNLLMKCYNPMVMTKNEELVKEIESWKKFDIVGVKGTLSSKAIKKSSYCEHCGKKNVTMGALVYVNPIEIEEFGHCSSEEECLDYLGKKREFSDLAYVVGTLCREPAKVKSRYAYPITQYQIAIMRKFHVREDPPEIRIDWPWVKSYGDNAVKDAQRLTTGAEVLIDGYLQTRHVERRAYCGQELDEKGHPKKNPDGAPVLRVGKDGKIDGCGEQYRWQDSVTELGVYSVEYLSGCKPEEASPGPQEGEVEEA